MKLSVPRSQTQLTKLRPLTKDQVKSSEPAEAVEGSAPQTDGFEESVVYDSPSTKTFGSIGAATGALVGRLAVPVATAALAASVGSALGPLGSIGAGIVGFAVGAYTEFKDMNFTGVFPTGRVVGGMLGGVLGAAVGKGLDLLGIDVSSKRMKEETKGFSLKKLWGRVKDVGYTSHEKVSPERIEEFKAQLKPGDVIVTSHDEFFNIEVPSMLAGAGGDWSHTAIYTGDNMAVEALLGEEVFHNTVDAVMGVNHHVKILRPKYEEGQAEKAVELANEFVGKPYEMAFNLDSDEKFGCIEVVHKAVQRAAPQLNFKPHKIFGKEWLSHSVFGKSEDVEVIDTTGSNFGYNYLSKFN